MENNEWNVESHRIDSTRYIYTILNVCYHLFMCVIYSAQKVSKSGYSLICISPLFLPVTRHFLSILAQIINWSKELLETFAFCTNDRNSVPADWHVSAVPTRRAQKLIAYYECQTSGPLISYLSASLPLSRSLSLLSYTTLYAWTDKIPELSATARTISVDFSGQRRCAKTDVIWEGEGVSRSNYIWMGAKST